LLLKLTKLTRTCKRANFAPFYHERVKLTSRIRQCCPLAPLLFIIAVNLLYDVIEIDPALEGINLGHTDKGTQLRVAGYADDTAIYMGFKLIPHASRCNSLRLSAYCRHTDWLHRLVASVLRHSSHAFLTLKVFHGLSSIEQVAVLGGGLPPLAGLANSCRIVGGLQQVLGHVLPSFVAPPSPSNLRQSVTLVRPLSCSCCWRCALSFASCG